MVKLNSYPTIELLNLSGFFNYYYCFLGTIFAVARLREQRKNSGESKRALNVWVKRVVTTARPADCQKCTCNLKNYHESVLDCRVCTPRVTPTVDTVIPTPCFNNRIFIYIFCVCI